MDLPAAPEGRPELVLRAEVVQRRRRREHLRHRRDRLGLLGILLIDDRAVGELRDHDGHAARGGGRAASRALERPGERLGAADTPERGEASSAGRRTRGRPPGMPPSTRSPQDDERAGGSPQIIIGPCASTSPRRCSRSPSASWRRTRASAGSGSTAATAGAGSASGLSSTAGSSGAAHAHAGYRSEVHLEARIPVEDWTAVLTGRLDGCIEREPGHWLIEELKSTHLVGRRGPPSGYGFERDRRQLLGYCYLWRRLGHGTGRRGPRLRGHRDRRGAVARVPSRRTPSATSRGVSAGARHLAHRTDRPGAESRRGRASPLPPHRSPTHPGEAHGRRPRGPPGRREPDRRGADRIRQDGRRAPPRPRRRASPPAARSCS